MKKAILLLLMSIIAIEVQAWSLFGPDNYEDCVLENLKGVNDKYVMAAIRNICRDKFPLKCEDLEDGTPVGLFNALVAEEEGRCVRTKPKKPIKFDTTSSEYDSSKIGKAAGGYLAAVDLVSKLKNSKCGYIFKEDYSIDDALDEISNYLNPTNRNELNSYVNSHEFKELLKENQQLINEYLNSSKLAGLDEKTSCGMAAGNFLSIYQLKKNEWDQIIK